MENNVPIFIIIKSLYFYIRIYTWWTNYIQFNFFECMCWTRSVIGIIFYCNGKILSFLKKCNLFFRFYCFVSSSGFRKHYTREILYKNVNFSIRIHVIYITTTNNNNVAINSSRCNIYNRYFNNKQTLVHPN